MPGIGSTIRKFLSNPFLIWYAISCRIRSWYYTNKVDEGGGRIRIKDHRVKFILEKERRSKLILKGDLSIQSYNGLFNPVTIILGEQASIAINGEFSLGSGVRLVV